MRGSYTQPSFLGGYISEHYQGRTDDPLYRQSLAASSNAHVLEEGPWTRRTGFQRITPTYLRGAAVVRPFLSSTSCAFAVEFTDSNMQFYSGNFPIFTSDKRTVSATSVVNPPTIGDVRVTLDTNSGWSVGDRVMLYFPPGFANSEAGARGRVFSIVSFTTGTSVLNLQDDVNEDYHPLSFPANAWVGATMMRIQRIATQWTAGLLQNIRVVQAQNQAVILNAAVGPKNLSVVEPTGSNDPVFSLADISFWDGPYHDPQPGSITVSGFTGSITITPNDGTTFTASDIGRFVRLLSEPLAWNSGTTYTYGQTVKYAGAYWQSIINGGGYTNLNVPPGTAPTQSNGAQILFWAPAPTAAVWCWGHITAQATTSATLLLGPDATAQGGGSATLPSANGTTINTWQLGTFIPGSYPTVGVFYEGRLWLMGATPNRFDATMPISTTINSYVFSPSDQYGNVNDNNGISYTFNSKENNVAEWMVQEEGGILVGTLGGEWLISAPNPNEGLTPTNVEAHQKTNFGSLFAEPRRTGTTLLFVQRYGRRVVEYLADAFSGKFGGRILNEKALDLSKDGIAEIAYQQESQPVLWCRTNSGNLAHTTYRRFSRFLTEPPQCNAWNLTQHANGYTVESMCVVPAESGGGDRLYIVVNQGGDRYIEISRPIVEVSDTLRNAWYVDSAQGNGLQNLVKCGGIFPSLGARGLGVFTPSDWSTVVDDGRCLNTPGVNIPSPGSALRAAAFNVFANCVSFNGGSTVYNFPNLPTSGASFTLSCWLYVVGTPQGALFQTPLSTTTGVQIAPLPGLAAAQDLPAFASGASGLITIGHQTYASGGQWVNVLVSWNGTTLQIYFNDTAQSSASMTGVAGTWRGAVLGGSAQFRLSPAYSVNEQPRASAGLTGAGVTPSAGDNGAMIAGLTEFWLLVGTRIDLSVAGNRQKFHTTDGASTYAPVSLGTHGETPTGGRPHIYLTGNPAQFQINRATGLQVATYNGNAQNGDPWLAPLDPRPSSILVPT